MSFTYVPFGSSIFSATEEVKLAEKAAFKRSGLSVKDWNCLDDVQRDTKIQNELNRNLCYNVG